MADVFVSYKAEDRARVRPLVEALAADGLSVWWDAHIGAGEEWRESIAENLDNAKCVIVIWSKRSVGPEGRFVRDEAARAVKRNAYLPVTIDKVEPPLGFGETQCLPLSGWKGSRDDPRYLTLLDAARQVITGARVPTHRAAAAADSGGGVDRRLVLAGGAVVGAAALGGAGWYLLNGSAASASSVAVMPFANLSGDPAQAYFSDGLAEELRSALSRIQGLKVIGRTSSEALRDDDAETAAKKLEVGNILTGSVRRSATTTRVSAQLVDGRDGVDKWSQTFDRPNGDALQIQTEIAEAVVAQLLTRLGTADKAALTLGGTKNPAAQDLFLKADGDVGLSKESLQSQLGLYEAAIALDPDYAAAHAGKSRAQSSLAGYYADSIDTLNRQLVESEATARKAIALAPDYAGGHSALAYSFGSSLQYRAAWQEYRRALDCTGVSSRTKLGIAAWMSRMGSKSGAWELWRQAKESDPLNPRVISIEAVLASNGRRFADAVTLFQKYLEQEPDSTGSRAGLAGALYFSGRDDEALREVEKLPKDFPTYFVVRSAIAARRGDRARAIAIMEDMRALNGDNGKYQYAQMLTAMGDREAALAELEGARQLRDPGFELLPNDPMFDSLRSDPRFKAIVAKIDYPEIA